MKKSLIKNKINLKGDGGPTILKSGRPLSKEGTFASKYREQNPLADKTEIDTARKSEKRDEC